MDIVTARVRLELTLLKLLVDANLASLPACNAHPLPLIARSARIVSSHIVGLAHRAVHRAPTLLGKPVNLVNSLAYPVILSSHARSVLVGICFT